jgi:5-methylcytosine-specific restriction endonuclease McrA
MTQQITNPFLPELSCHYCDYKGNDYLIKDSGPHTEARCPNCSQQIKYLSKADKYGTKEQQAQIWEKTKGRCCYCGIPLNMFKKNEYTVEHMDPQCKGGNHVVENLYPACKSCNSQKGGKTLGEYRTYMKEKNSKKTWVFYFEIMEYSAIGDILKAIFG